MAILKVAVPVWQDRRVLTVAKGRKWSLVEHLILDALHRSPSTAGELAEEGLMPRRLVIEALIRLMKAGWVEIQPENNKAVFKISRLGSSVVKRDELPNYPATKTRPANFFIDRLTFSIFRRRDFRALTEQMLQQRSLTDRIAILSARSELVMPTDPYGVAQVLLDEDESLIGSKPSYAKPAERHVLFTVKDGAIENRPKYLSGDLEKLILRAAEFAGKTPPSDAIPLISPPDIVAPINRPEPEAKEIAFSAEDVVFGGAEHRDLLSRTLGRAKHRLIIHSTFIDEDRFISWLPELKRAQQRGVLIDIFWGDNKQAEQRKGTAQAVGALRKKLQQEGLLQQIRLHAFTTNSHSKLLVADDGSEESFFAVVGSCNWLSSPYQSAELSVRLRDPSLVSEVIGHLAAMSVGLTGIETPITNSLLALAGRVALHRVPPGGRAKASLVLGPQHAAYVRKARDEAQAHMIVASHRLGVAARPVVIVPAIAAAKKRGISARVFYEKASDPVTVKMAKDLERAVRDEGINLKELLGQPSMHAKFLLWDNDHLVVTSLNWLSGDPTDGNLRQEIGVYVNCPSIGRDIATRFSSRYPHS